MRRGGIQSAALLQAASGDELFKKFALKFGGAGSGVRTEGSPGALSFKTKRV